MEIGYGVHLLEKEVLGGFDFNSLINQARIKQAESKSPFSP